METYAVRRPPSVTFGDGNGAAEMDTLSWIVVHFAAWSLVVFVAWRAIKWLRNRTRDGHAAASTADDVNGGGELMTKPSVSETKPLVPQTEEGNYP